MTHPHTTRLHNMLLGLTIIAVVLLAAGGTSLSLATDAGTTDARVAQACEAGTCARVVHYLNATGFPHASTAPAETYALTEAGAVQEVVRVNWANQTAAVTPALAPGEVPTATLDLQPDAYAYLVDALRTGAHAPSPSAAAHASLPTALRFLFHSSVRLAAPDPLHLKAGAYELAVAHWAATLPHS